MNTQLILARLLGRLKFIQLVREIEKSQAKQRREAGYVNLALWLRWLGMIGVNTMSLIAINVPQYYFWLGMFISLSVGYLISSIFTTRRATIIWIRKYEQMLEATCPDKIKELEYHANETFDKMLLELPYIFSNVLSCVLAVRNIAILG